jgi:hypothetical protein
VSATVGLSNGSPSNIGSLSPQLMATKVSHSKQSTKHGESPLAAEEWQLRILWELHKKQPRPTVEQRKQLAVQTGL